MSNNPKETIKELISNYNGANPDSPLIIIDSNELIDTKDLYICLYNNKEIGLFIKERLKSEVIRKEHRSGYSTLSFPTYTHYYYEANVYIGYDDKSVIGINVLHRNEFSVNEWCDKGYETQETTYEVPYYRSTCHITKTVNFNKIREKMIQNGDLEYCLIGKTTLDEINAVLSYARKYFEPTNPKTKERKPQ